METNKVGTAEIQLPLGFGQYMKGDKIGTLEVVEVYPDGKYLVKVPRRMAYFLPQERLQLELSDRKRKVTYTIIDRDEVLDGVTKVTIRVSDNKCLDITDHTQLDAGKHSVTGSFYVVPLAPGDHAVTLIAKDEAGTTFEYKLEVNVPFTRPQITPYEKPIEVNLGIRTRVRMNIEADRQDSVTLTAKPAEGITTAVEKDVIILVANPNAEEGLHEVEIIATGKGGESMPYLMKYQVIHYVPNFQPLEDQHVIVGKAVTFDVLFDSYSIPTSMVVMAVPPSEEELATEPHVFFNPEANRWQMSVKGLHKGTNTFALRAQNGSKFKTTTVKITALEQQSVARSKTPLVR